MKLDGVEFVRLTVAAERAGMNVSALRAEARRGHLAVYRVANKDWTTETAVREMFERCRVPQKEPASISAPGVNAPESAPLPCTSSLTEGGNLALASALATARALKGGSPHTLLKNTSRNAENVVSAKFGLPT
jgi:hypothetical protein